ncbi:MAG: TraB/GumN family protein [Deltaproteobacteria bacterium]|jgi:uncharacterized protein YbaP (TraB family)|nr:TraB/GumN family protein [Deltaproteobacteria bacterium]
MSFPRLKRSPAFVSALLAWAVLLWTVATAQADAGFLWTIEALDGRRLHLLGSIHVASESFYPLNRTINEIFENSKELIVEVDVTRTDEALKASKFIKKGVYFDGRTLWDDLDAEMTTLLEAKLVDSVFDKQSVSFMKPWLTALTLEIDIIKRLGYDEKLGVDIHFLERAKAKGLPINELETLEEQISLFTNMSENESILMLKSVLMDEETTKDIEELTKAWRDGDVDGFYDVYFRNYIRNPDLMPLMDRLIHDRNFLMFERLKPFFRPRGQEAFAVAGSAHLVGPDGLPALFEKNGYRVEQLQLAVE